MAYLYQRRDGRIEIRESTSTPQGPRSRTLVSFRGPLLPEHLDRAEAAARRRFDRAAIASRARELGVAVQVDSADAPARDLLARLRRGAVLDPRLAALLRERLAMLPAAPVPDDLADAAEWIGASELERSRGLRDVLRLYDAITRSREPVRSAPVARIPRFRSRPPRSV
jgi:hypothetical protein